MEGDRYYRDMRVADEYDEKRFRSRGGRYIRETEKKVYLELAGPLQGKRVLDVGAGTGRPAIDFAERGAEVVATDIAQEMLEKGRKKAYEEGVDVEFQQMDARELEYEKNSFDIVTAQRFFHVSSDPLECLEEMRRVAREKVIFDFFSVYSSRLFYTWLLPMDSILRRPQTFRDYLEEKDLELVEERSHFFLPYGLIRNRNGLPAKTLLWLEEKTSSNLVLENFNSVYYMAAEPRD